MMWESRDGTKIEIKDMVDRHIINSLNLVVAGKLTVKEDVFNCLVKESVFRKIITSKKATELKELNKYNLSLNQFDDDSEYWYDPEEFLQD